MSEDSEGTGTVEVVDALRLVDDPEYPGISVVDMGMIGPITVDQGRVRIELIPTFSGCPALDLIADDIKQAVSSLDGVDEVDVARSAIVWETARLSDQARRTMAAEFTVAVADPRIPTVCPRCNEEALVELSMFGPTRCRAIHRCSACHETVEVVRA